MGFVYRFIDKDDEIIYIGKTTGEMRIRMFGHKHLPQECYDSIIRIEFSELKSIADLGIYEIYLINKYKPVYNVASKYDGTLTCELPDLTWSLYNPKETTIENPFEECIKEVKEVRCRDALKTLSNEIFNLQRAYSIIEEFINICDEEQAPLIWKNIEMLFNNNTDTVFKIRSSIGDAMYFLYEGLRLYHSDVFNSPVGQYINLVESFTIENDEYIIEVGEKWLPYLHYITDKLKYEIRVRENKAAMYQMQLGQLKPM